jgi:hypothetical protein
MATFWTLNAENICVEANRFPLHYDNTRIRCRAIQVRQRTLYVSDAKIVNNNVDYAESIRR